MPGDNRQSRRFWKNLKWWFITPPTSAKTSRPTSPTTTLPEIEEIPIANQQPSRTESQPLLGESKPSLDDISKRWKKSKRAQKLIFGLQAVLQSVLLGLVVSALVLTVSVAIATGVGLVPSIIAAAAGILFAAILVIPSYKQIKNAAIKDIDDTIKRHKILASLNEKSNALRDKLEISEKPTGDELLEIQKLVNELEKVSAVKKRTTFWSAVWDTKIPVISGFLSFLGFSAQPLPALAPLDVFIFPVALTLAAGYLLSQVAVFLLNMPFKRKETMSQFSDKDTELVANINREIASIKNTIWYKNLQKKPENQLADTEIADTETPGQDKSLPEKTGFVIAGEILAVIAVGIVTGIIAAGVSVAITAATFTVLAPFTIPAAIAMGIFAGGLATAVYGLGLFNSHRADKEGSWFERKVLRAINLNNLNMALGIGLSVMSLITCAILTVTAFTLPIASVMAGITIGAIGGAILASALGCALTFLGFHEKKRNELKKQSKPNVDTLSICNELQSFVSRYRESKAPTSTPQSTTGTVGSRLGAWRTYGIVPPFVDIVVRLKKSIRRLKKGSGVQNLGQSAPPAVKPSP